MNDPTTLNCAIVRAFGLDPNRIRPGATIVLDKAGPIITVEYIVRDEDGHMFVNADGDLATVLRQYKLVPA